MYIENKHYVLCMRRRVIHIYYFAHGPRLEYVYRKIYMYTQHEHKWGLWLYWLDSGVDLGKVSQQERNVLSFMCSEVSLSVAVGMTTYKHKAPIFMIFNDIGCSYFMLIIACNTLTCHTFKEAKCIAMMCFIKLCLFYEDWLYPILLYWRLIVSHLYPIY